MLGRRTWRLLGVLLGTALAVVAVAAVAWLARPGDDGPGLDRSDPNPATADNKAATVGRAELAPGEEAIGEPVAGALTPGPSAASRSGEPRRMPASESGKAGPMPTSGKGEKAPASPRELAGVSRLYDDLQCRLIQTRHGVRVPSGATIVEIDGERLRLVNPGRLAESPAPILFLPRGAHTVVFREGERGATASIASEFLDEYRAMRGHFGVGEAARREELLRRSAWALAVHGAPFLPSFWGSFHAAKGDWAAAERAFRRALRINPAFSPAHLNLAECLMRRKAAGEAAREVALAEAFNVGDVFGLSEAVATMRQRVGADENRDSVDLSEVSYASAEPLSEEDRRIASILEGIAEFAVDEGERAKLLANLAVHFAESGRPERAIAHYHDALAALRAAAPESRYDLAPRILRAMGDVAAKAGFGEAEDYRQIGRILSDGGGLAR